MPTYYTLIAINAIWAQRPIGSETDRSLRAKKINRYVSEGQEALAKNHLRLVIIIK
jgi:hypothetical protein